MNYENIDQAIDLLARKILRTPDLSSNDAIRYSEAALNLARTKEMLVIIEQGPQQAQGETYPFIGPLLSD